MGTSPLPPAVKSVDGNGGDTGLTLTYSSSDTSVIDVNGINLEPKGVGSATITVSQSGDTNYNAATSKTFTVTVTEKSPYSDSVAGLVMWLDGKDVNGDRLAEDRPVPSSPVARYNPGQTVRAMPIHSPRLPHPSNPPI